MTFNPIMPNFNIFGMGNCFDTQNYAFPQLSMQMPFVNNFNFPQLFNFPMFNSYAQSPYFGFNFNQSYNPYSSIFTNNFGFNDFSTNKTNYTSQVSQKQNSQLNKPSSSNYSTAIRDKAKSYVGKVNSSAKGNELFSPKGYKNTSWYRKHGRWGWCCDFAVSCAKDVLGDKYPKNMITSYPDGLGNSGKKNNAYLEVPSTNKEKWLEENIKPGYIIHMKGSGDSGRHIAIVDYVKGGKIHAISGNSGGKVREVDYDINRSGIFGFIDMDRALA